jgi:hypothetical protein
MIDEDSLMLADVVYRGRRPSGTGIDSGDSPPARYGLRRAISTPPAPRRASFFSLSPLHRRAYLSPVNSSLDAEPLGR